MGFLHAIHALTVNPMYPTIPVVTPCRLRSLPPEACEAIQGGAISMPVLSLKTLLHRLSSVGSASAPSSDPGGSSITNIGSIGTSMVSVGAIYL